MKKLLIISSGEKSLSAVRQLLMTEYAAEPESAESAAEGRKLALEGEYDAIIIASPLKDEAADKLAVDLTKRTDAGVLLIVGAENEAETEKLLLPYGVFVLSKPLGRTLFLKAMHLLEAAGNRVKDIRNENRRLQQQIDETRIINRAKAVLIRYLSMTEPQAHKYLEKQAMDLRITKLEVAKRLLSTYDY